MPTLRLYLQNAAAPYTPATIRGAWDTTTTGASALGTSKNGAVTDVSAIDNLQADHDRLLRRFSYVLAEDTYFAGSVQGAVGCYETSDDLNAHLHLHLFVLQGQSNDLRGTLWADYIDPDEAPSNTSLCGEGFSGTLTPLQAVAGDVLVLEVGYRSNNSSGTTRSGGIYYGGTGATDLTDGGDAAQYPGWVELEYALSSDTLEPTGIVSAEAFGTATVQPGPVAVSPGGIPSAEAFGTPILAVGAVTLGPTGIPSAEAFGSPSVGTALISIERREGPEGEWTEVHLGLEAPGQWLDTYEFTPGITYYYRARRFDGGHYSDYSEIVELLFDDTTVLYPTGIPSAEVFGAPTLLVEGALQIVGPIGIPSGETFGNPALISWQLVQTIGIESGEAFGNPTLVMTSLVISPQLGSGQCFIQPIISGRATIQAVSPGSARLQPITAGEVRIR